MEKRELKKLIKKEFKDIRENNGFFLQTDTEFLKVTEHNVLHNITFERWTHVSPAMWLYNPFICMSILMCLLLVWEKD